MQIVTWLCECGAGQIGADPQDTDELPPEFCPQCGFDLWGYFGLRDDWEDTQR